MEQLKISHQTLREFIESPFGNPDNQKRLQYEDRYQKYKRNNKIRVEATLEIDKNYFIHLKVPSESQKGTTVYYDVVVQFFTTNSDVEKELNLRNYYVQFFSNSPGFVYQYATLYRIEGYLIETLTDKFTPGALEILPDKANKDYKLFQDLLSIIYKIISGIHIILSRNIFTFFFQFIHIFIIIIIIHRACYRIMS